MPNTMEGGGYYEGLTSPEVEKRPILPVIKESERAVFIQEPDGHKMYLGEAGNSSYKNREKMFTYIAGTGVHVDGHKNSVDLDEDSLFQLFQYRGSMKTADFFGGKDKEMSSDEYMERMGRLTGHVNFRLDLLFQSFKRAGFLDNYDARDFERAYTRLAMNKQEQYSPEELLASAVEVIQEEMEESFELGEEKISENDVVKFHDMIKRTHILDNDPEKSRRGIVDFFGLWRQLKQTGTSHEELVQAIEDFPFNDVLIDEYKRAPDDRFGGALVSACQEVKEKWEKQGYFER